MTEMLTAHEFLAAVRAYWGDGEQEMSGADFIQFIDQLLERTEPGADTDRLNTTSAAVYVDPETAGRYYYSPEGVLMHYAAGESGSAPRAGGERVDWENAPLDTLLPARRAQFWLHDQAEESTAKPAE